MESVVSVEGLPHRAVLVQVLGQDLRSDADIHLLIEEGLPLYLLRVPSPHHLHEALCPCTGDGSLIKRALGRHHLPDQLFGDPMARGALPWLERG